MKTVNEEWIVFRDSVIPKDAPDYQIRDMKKGFYGGAAILLTILMDLAKQKAPFNGEMVTKHLTSLMKELTDFAREVLQEVK